jgi:hypothetical protein
MSALLQSLHLAPSRRGKIELSGLVSIKNDCLPPCSIAEKVAQREAAFLEGSKETENIGIDYIFFRRFADERSSQVAAYILDNSTEKYKNEQIAELHYRVWLSGNAPLLYVEWPTRVDVLKCAADPVFWDYTNNRVEYFTSATIKTVSDISKILEDASSKRFSAYRLSDGTFWDDPENAGWACADKAAHKSLVQAVVEADKRLNGAGNPLMRRLLLLFILAKYLEDRGVFPKNWFNNFHTGASSFLDVLASGKANAVRQVLTALKQKFNGDIFDISSGIEQSLTRDSLTHFTTLLGAKTLDRQMFLWKQFSFSFIPVEVLSHLYQHFAQKGKGAVFTPPFVADLMLDHAMPYEKMTGRETIFDPTCGSGIFLVGAFRRLVHYWQSQNEWMRPSAAQLKKMLKASIFGAELDPNSAQVTAFNLALAICDALQPKVIWRHLKFDILIGQNILVGDVFEYLPRIRKIVPEGFTTVLGNPPFLSKLTGPALHTRSEHKVGAPIPDRQMSYRIAEEAMALLASEGRMCLIQTAGFLYNAKARRFLADFISSNTLETILDFVSIRGLFENADAKTIAVVAKPGIPDSEHEIIHQTFRRTKSVHDQIGFELDHYDRHIVAQTTAIASPWVWKANLLGGGRLLALVQKAGQFENFKDYFRKQGWDYGEGFIEGTSGQRAPAPWLTGQPYLPTQNLQADGVIGKTDVVKATQFRSAYTPERYTGPIIMVRANEQLPCAYRSDGFLAYRAKIIGISSDAEDKQSLRGFWEFLSENKEILRFLIYIFSTQMLVGKSTAFLKRDFDELPSPESGFFERLSWWEKYLIGDVLDYFAEMVRTGHNSELTVAPVDRVSFQTYSHAFCKLLGSVYTNLRTGRWGLLNGLAYQAFYFGGRCELDWPDDWSAKLASVVHKENSAIHTSRVVRLYEKNTLVIVKPDRMRHWIPSTAIRDADETLVELQQQGF